MVSAWPSGRMLREHAGELGPAARILVLVRLPHRRVGIFCRGGRDAFLGEHLAGLGRQRLHRLALLRIGRRAPAATRRRDRHAALRIADADMQRGIGAHGMADHVRLLDLERIHQRNDVVARNILRIARRVGRHVRRRIAALAEGDAAMRAGEIPHLRLPGAIVGGIFVHEDDRRAGAGLLAIDPDAVRRRDVRHDAYPFAGPPSAAR